MHSLSNKVAVITGGTRGLGLAIARAYAHEGLRRLLRRPAPAVEIDVHSVPPGWPIQPAKTKGETIP
jgi:NAD(P)-dependent dehydrogenase (short-subunit alcohol dehydrogenase family)